MVLGVARASSKSVGVGGLMLVVVDKMNSQARVPHVIAPRVTFSRVTQVELASHPLGLCKKLGRPFVTSHLPTPSGGWVFARLLTGYLPVT